MITFLLFLGAKGALAQTSSYGQLQAAYLFNFAKYIRWPIERQQFVIGVYQDAEIMTDLETTLKGKRVRGKEIVLRKIMASESLSECNIIYLSGSNSRSISALLALLSGKNILLVTEEDLIKKGATISFVVEEDRLRFIVRKKALEQAGLMASEGLLELAIIF